MRKVKKAMLLMGSTACVLIGTAHAASEQDMAAIFGARPSIEQVSLSPDGMRLAYVQPMMGQGAGLYIADLTKPDAEPRKITNASGNPERLEGCHWTSNTRLLCRIFGITRLDNSEIAQVTRYVALDSDGSNLQVVRNQRGSGTALGYALFGGSVVDWNPGEDGHVLMLRQYIPEETTGTRLAQTKDGFGVDDVDTTTLKVKVRETAKNDASEYISDGNGVIRIMGVRPKHSTNEYTSGETRYFYRRPDERKWEALSVIASTNTGFNPYAVDSVANIAYGLKRLDGRDAAYSVTLDGSMKETLLFARPDVDIDGFIRMGRKRRVIGVTYSTERPETHYFDPALQKLMASLSKALPKLPLIRFLDSSQDENRLLVWAGSDTDPGRYYLFDRAARKLSELMLVRPAMEKMSLATVTPVSYRAADGTMVPGYLTLPPGGKSKGLPAIVMPHGGPEGRDEWGFDWLSQYFANQGYAVLQPNFRGSTGYGAQWFRNNGFKDWRIAIGDIDDGGRWLQSSGIAAPGKIAIFGWSYGGYAALQSAVIDPGLFKAVIAVAPVTDLDRLKTDWQGWSNYMEMVERIGTGPHIAAGSPARHAGEIKVPLLLFHGTTDRNVDVGHSQLMQARLKEAGVRSELVTYKNLDHQLDDNIARADMLRKSVALLRETIGSVATTPPIPKP